MTQPPMPDQQQVTFETLADNITQELRLHDENYGDEYYAKLIEAMKEAATTWLAGQRQGVPDGWQLVPIQSTFEMNSAGFYAVESDWDGNTLELSKDDFETAYKAMLEVAPLPPVEG